MTETESRSQQAARTKGILKGRDVQREITVSFKESALGCNKEVSFARNEICDTCFGTGEKPQAPKTTCQVCNGTGHIVTQINNVTML